MGDTDSEEDLTFHETDSDSDLDEQDWFAERPATVPAAPVNITKRPKSGSARSTRKKKHNFTTLNSLFEKYKVNYLKSRTQRVPSDKKNKILQQIKKYNNELEEPYTNNHLEHLLHSYLLKNVINYDINNLSVSDLETCCRSVAYNIMSEKTTPIKYRRTFKKNFKDSDISQTDIRTLISPVALPSRQNVSLDTALKVFNLPEQERKKLAKKVLEPRPKPRAPTRRTRRPAVPFIPPVSAAAAFVPEPDSDVIYTEPPRARGASGAPVSLPAYHDGHESANLGKMTYFRNNVPYQVWKYGDEEATMEYFVPYKYVSVLNNLYGVYPANTQSSNLNTVHRIADSWDHFRNYINEAEKPGFNKLGNMYIGWRDSQDDDRAVYTSKFYIKVPFVDDEGVEELINEGIVKSKIKKTNIDFQPRIASTTGGDVSTEDAEEVWAKSLLKERPVDIAGLGSIRIEPEIKITYEQSSIAREILFYLPPELISDFQALGAYFKKGETLAVPMFVMQKIDQMIENDEQVDDYEKIKKLNLELIINMRNLETEMRQYFPNNINMLEMNKDSLQQQWQNKINKILLKNKWTRTAINEDFMQANNYYVVPLITLMKEDIIPTHEINGKDFNYIDLQTIGEVSSRNELIFAFGQQYLLGSFIELIYNERKANYIIAETGEEIDILEPSQIPLVSLEPEERMNLFMSKLPRSWQF